MTSKQNNYARNQIMIIHVALYMFIGKESNSQGKADLKFPRLHDEQLWWDTLDHQEK